MRHVDAGEALTRSAPWQGGSPSNSGGSRDRGRGRNRSPEKGDDADGVRDRSREREREPPRDPQGGARPWKVVLDALIGEGKLGAGELDERSLAPLEGMKPEDANAAMERFGEANLGKITNKSSFLAGIIRRIQEEGGSTDLIQALDSMPHPVRSRLRELVDQGRLRPGDLESRVTTAMRDLPVEVALEAVDRYQQASGAARSGGAQQRGVVAAEPPRRAGAALSGKSSPKQR